MEAQQQQQPQQQLQLQQQQQQQPQQYGTYQYETTQNNLTNSSLPQSYDSSQIQSYDQSSYYYSDPYNNASTHQPTYQTKVDYSSSSSQYYPDYSTSYQIHDHNSIHLHGVPDPADAHQTLVPNPQDVYYQSPHGYLPASQPVYRVGGSHGGISLRGSGRGTFGRHDRGRGRGRGKHATSQLPESGQGQVDAGKVPPRLSWCEVCRVDCNTPEILEQHRNGKKHQKNVKVFEELKNLSRQLTVQNPQMPISHPKAEVADKNQFSTEHVSSASDVHAENNSETAPGSDMAVQADPSVAQSSGVTARNDGLSVRGGFKRNMRGGRGGKWMRAADGSYRHAEPPKPKQMVPLLCDLCNVKCESKVVYESHLAGKKHLSNVKRFQGHKEAFGEAVQALYPTIPNLPSTSIISQSTIPNLPSTSIISQSTSDIFSSAAIVPPSTSSLPQSNPQGLQDANALASMMLSQQNLPDPPAAQAALAQLLNQHGIHDTQTLIAQLVPHLLAQLQTPAVASSSAPGLAPDTANLQTEEPLSSTKAESQNACVEIKIEQQNLNVNAGSEAEAGTDTNPDDAPPEDRKVEAD